MQTAKHILWGFIAIIGSVLIGGALIIRTSMEQEIQGFATVETTCTPPDTWTAHLVQAGENLTVIGEMVGLAPAELVIANCLQGDIHPGDTIYLPPPSLMGESCGPPEGWQLYTIQAGDTLPALAKQYAVTEDDLWHANCISESMTFSTGFRIYVPTDSRLP